MSDKTGFIDEICFVFCGKYTDSAACASLDLYKFTFLPKTFFFHVNKNFSGYLTNTTSAKLNSKT